MKKIVGNYLLQPNRDFPIDCELFASIQGNIDLLSVIGNIAGNKVILSGCELEQNNTKRTAGYVFVKTAEYPEGEILYFEGGTVADGMYVKTEATSVSSQGYIYPQAYTIRSLAAGVGTENFSWSDFKNVSTTPVLEGKISALEVALESMTPPPLGIIEMWAGKTVPAGYALCDGAQLRIVEYPDLYAALGTTFNTAADYNGSAVTTDSEFFRLPDLRGRFVVGYNPADSEYNAFGKSGGEKKHVLTASEMPEHSHTYSAPVTNDKHPGGDSGYDRPNRAESLTTGAAGGNAAHENRPPFYSLAYIIKTTN